MAWARALRAVSREMMAAYEKLRSRCDKETELAKTEQARNQLRQSCNDESLKATQNFLALYEDKYKAEVLILRGAPTKDRAARSSESPYQCFRLGRSSLHPGGAG